MPIESRATLISETEGYVDDHKCAYAERILQEESRRQMGSHGINLAFLWSHVRELAYLHANGDCPPTSQDNGPTREWAEWVKDTAI